MNIKTIPLPFFCWTTSLYPGRAMKVQLMPTPCVCRVQLVCFSAAYYGIFRSVSLFAETTEEPASPKEKKQRIDRAMSFWMVACAFRFSRLTACKGDKDGESPSLRSVHRGIRRQTSQSKKLANVNSPVQQGRRFYSATLANCS